MRTYAKLSSLGFELVALVLLALFVNKWAMTKFDLQGLGPALFLFIAMGLWIYRVISTLNSIDKDEKSGNLKED